MSLSLTSVLRVRSDVRFRRVGDESVAVRQQAGEVMVLNGVGGRILELIDGERPLSSFAHALEREFEVDRATLEQELLRFASELEESGLIEVLPAGAHRA